MLELNSENIYKIIIIISDNTIYLYFIEEEKIVLLINKIH